MVDSWLLIDDIAINVSSIWLGCICSIAFVVDINVLVLCCCRQEFCAGD